MDYIISIYDREDDYARIKISAKNKVVARRIGGEIKKKIGHLLPVVPGGGRRKLNVEKEY